MKTTLLIADDHPLIRAGLKLLISSVKQYQVTGEASDGIAAIAMLDENTPDIAILDIDMPQKTGIEVAMHVAACHPETKVIFLTSHASFTSFSEAIKTNYAGFIFKESALDEMLQCLEKVRGGEKYVSPVFLKFIESNKGEVQRIEEIKLQMATLSSTEKRILLLISEGKTTPAIAKMLFNSEKTIENHRYNICSKLRIKGPNNLFAFALENKQIIHNLLVKE